MKNSWISGLPRKLNQIGYMAKEASQMFNKLPGNDSNFRKLTPELLATINTGALLYLLMTQQFISENYPLLERSAVGLVVLLLILLFSKRFPNQLVIPLSLLGLILAMGISLIQLPASFLARDFLAYVLIAVYAVVSISIFGIKFGIQSVVIANALIAAVVLVSLATNQIDSEFAGGRLVGTSYGSNTLAASIGITIPAVMFFSLSNKILTYSIRALLLATSYLLLFLTGARTSWVVAIIVFTSWIFILLFKKLGKSATWILIAPFSVAIYFGLNFQVFLNALGKNSDLSGRVPLWNAYIEKIQEHPLTGYGWAVQTLTDMPLGQFIAQRIGVPLTNAHNDFLNWWALTGIFGATFFAISLLSLIIGGVMVRKFSPHALWIFLVGIQLGTSGLTELTTMYADGWMVFSIALVSLSVLLSKFGPKGITNFWLIVLKTTTSIPSK